MLRFIAALWVAVFHGAMAGVFTGLPSLVDFIINFGYAGVDIFFVISGVIMAHSTKNIGHGLKAAAAFLIVRFSRIYTGWWPALLLYVFFFGMTHQLGPSVNLLSSFTLYYTDLSGLINIAIWSLMFELYFYIILAMGMCFSRYLRDLLFAVIFILLVLVNAYIFINRSSLYPESEINWIKMFYVSPLVIEFFMGYFLYAYLQPTLRISWKIWGVVAVMLILLIIYSMPYFSDHSFGLANSYYWSERAVLVGGAALAIIGMALALPAPKNIISLALVKLGDYSYSIYLLHILAFNMLLNLLPWAGLGDNARLLAAFATMVCLLIASAIYYRWVEYPIYMFFRANAKRWVGISAK